MARPSNREKILTEGLRVVQARGFGGASVRDIVHAAGVPQGSFTNHFVSKEAFGLEVLDLYFRRASAIIARTLGDTSLPPLRRLRAYIDARRDVLNENGMRNGCLFGNLTAEASEANEPIRLRILEIFTEVRARLLDCLRDAVAAGEVPGNLDCEEVAGFIVSSLQGAILLAKAERSPEPIERFKSVLFGRVLR
jgi:TetR/AcrR family transcriptional regulator, transcriptional repressor for nem operon